MRFWFGWFLLFIILTFVFGWAEVGLIWMLCNSALDISCFFPLLGIAMTVNLCISGAWAVGVDNYHKNQRRGISDEHGTTSR